MEETETEKEASRHMKGKILEQGQEQNYPQPTEISRHQESNKIPFPLRPDIQLHSKTD